MIAQTIPYTRTPRGTNVFDYAIPAGMDCGIGEMVEIPFRSKTTLGVVWALADSSPVKSPKKILATAGYGRWKDPLQRDFLQWFAQYYFISLPQALKTLQYPRLKRPRHHTLISKNNAGNKQNKAQNGSAVYDASQVPHLIRWNRRRDCITLYHKLASGRKTLIVAPEYATVRELAGQFDGFPLIAFDTEPSPSKLMALEQLLAVDSPCLVIATRKILSLPVDRFQRIIVDQEEARGHKQFDLNPRYHTVDALVHLHSLYAGSSSQFTLFLSSHAPSVSSYSLVRQGALAYTEAADRSDSPGIEIVDMEDEYKKKNYSWFSDRLLERMEHKQPCLLLINRKGNYRGTVCQDCSAVLPESTGRCTRCGGTHLKQFGKGTKQLEAELKERFRAKRIVRVDAEDAASHSGLQEAEIVIATERIFRLLPLSHFAMIGVLSVDHLLLYPHYQSHERVFQLLTYLASVGDNIVLQTHAPNHPVIRAAAINAYEQFMGDELDVRRMLNTPPFSEQFALVNKTTGKKTLHKGTLEAETLSPEIVVDRLR